MGKVIFKMKNGNSITIPEFIFKRLMPVIRLYKQVELSFDVIDKNVSEVVFDGCTIDFIYIPGLKLTEEQKVSFVKCNFEKYTTILGGNVVISGSSIDSGLDIKECSSVELLSSSLAFVRCEISADVVHLNDFYSSNGTFIDISSNNISIVDSVLNYSSVALTAPNLSIKDSVIEYMSYNVNTYDSLMMDNVEFVSDNYDPIICFRKIIDGNFMEGFNSNEVAIYHQEAGVELTDKDFSDLKHQGIYSLLSVLKACGNKLNDKNNEDIKRIVSEINEDYVTHIYEIEQQQSLEQQKIQLRVRTDRAIENVKKNIYGRKIKSLIK